MNEIESENCWSLPKEHDEKPDPGETAILANWPMVAAVAWEGYQEHGRGTVIVDENGALEFLPGSPCECHQKFADNDDPEEQAVVALHEDKDIRSVQIVAGWPAPPDAVMITPAERLRLTAH